MDFIVKRIWWIAIPTAMAVLIFQLYWLRTSYLSQQTSFEQVASDALQKAYDKSVIASIEQLKHAGHSKTIQQRPNKVIPRSTGQISKIELSSTINLSDLKNLKLNPSSLKEDGNYTKIVTSNPSKNKSDTVYAKKFTLNETNKDINRFLSSMLSYGSIVEVDHNILNKTYREELKNRRILLPFKLSILKKDTVVAKNQGAIYIHANSAQAPKTIIAQFNGLSKALLVKILWPIVLSFFLVALITGCIWVLSRIILRQKKLEHMKNDFISNITHELKTPLAILSATNEALLDFGGIKDPDKTERYLRLGQEELHKLQGLVDNIMALTRMEHGDDKNGTEEIIPIHALLKAVVSRYTDLPGVDIHTDIQIKDELVRTQPEALKTILSNLLDNAIKYTPTAEKHIQILVRQNEQHHLFSVIDNGIGIDKAHLAFIFDKFYRVPHGDIHEVKGYGLGLSHVKSLVQKLGGEIWVDSEPMQGTVFTLQLNRK